MRCATSNQVLALRPSLWWTSRPTWSPTSLVFLHFTLTNLVVKYVLLFVCIVIVQMPQFCCFSAHRVEKALVGYRRSCNVSRSVMRSQRRSIWSKNSPINSTVDRSVHWVMPLLGQFKVPKLHIRISGSELCFFVSIIFNLKNQKTKRIGSSFSSVDGIAYRRVRCEEGLASFGQHRCRDESRNNVRIEIKEDTKNKSDFFVVVVIFCCCCCCCCCSSRATFVEPSTRSTQFFDLVLWVFVFLSTEARTKREPTQRTVSRN